MDELKKVWEFLSGKKTAIGMTMVLMAGAISTFFVSSEMDPAPVIKGIVGVLEYAGQALGAVGLAHKAVKK